MAMKRLPAILALLVALFAAPAYSQPATRPTTAPATRPAVAPVSHLPVVWLDVPETIPPDGRAGCTAMLFLPGADVAQAELMTGGIRYRGASSRAYPKKPYALALDSPAGMLGMPARKHWILNAAYIDRSLMRHKLAYDLFRSLSTPEAPRMATASEFVEVYMNGDYLGVYLLMERIDRDLLGMASFVAGDVPQACVYKAVNHQSGFFMPGREGFEQQEPDPLTTPYWEPLEELMKFVQSASPAEFLHPETGIAAWFDLDNAIDFHLLVLLTQNADGITKNFYLARHRQESGPRGKFFFVPWDYDGTFGRNWDSSPLPATLWLSNGLFDRLLRDPAYRERFAARWDQLREKEFAVETVQAMIDANAATIGAAAARNVERWPTTQRPYHGRVTFEQDVEQMKTWVAARIAWLDQHIHSRAPNPERRRRPVTR